MTEKLSFIVESSSDIVQFIPYNADYIGEKSEKNKSLFKHPEDFFIALAGSKASSKAKGPILPRTLIGLDYQPGRKIRGRWTQDPVTRRPVNMEKGLAPEILPKFRAKNFIGRNSGYGEDRAWNSLREAFYTRFYPEDIIESGGTVLLHTTKDNWDSKRRYKAPPIDLETLKDYHGNAQQNVIQMGGYNNWGKLRQLAEIREKYGIGDEHPPKWYPAHQFENALFNVLSLYDETFNRNTTSSITGRSVRSTYPGKTLFTSLKSVFKTNPDYRVTDDRSEEWKTGHLARLKDSIASFKSGNHEAERDKVWEHLASMGFSENTLQKTRKVDSSGHSYRTDSQEESLSDHNAFKESRGSMLLMPDRSKPRGIVVHHDYAVSPVGTDSSRIRIIGYNGKTRMSPIVLPMSDLNKITTTIQDLSTKLSNSKASNEFVHTGLAREVRDRENPNAALINIEGEDQSYANGGRADYGLDSYEPFIFDRESAERSLKPVSLDLGSSPEDFRSNFLRRNL